MRVYRTGEGGVVESDGRFNFLPGLDWDSLFAQTDLEAYLRALLPSARTQDRFAGPVLAPIAKQEVWAAGVTYYRSRTARVQESKMAGAGSFYDRVYDAARPELFFKANASRVAGDGEEVGIREDSRWNVPEPELTLAIGCSGHILGYTIGNDMSARDIEGENPLYLPQAKVYDLSCSLGPGLLVQEAPLARSTEIALEIRRQGREVFRGKTQIGAIKRPLEELVSYLFRHTSFPFGCFLLTGTGIVPPDDFTLQHGDEVLITIEPIGTLRNVVRLLPAMGRQDL